MGLGLLPVSQLDQVEGGAGMGRLARTAERGDELMEVAGRRCEYGSCWTVGVVRHGGKLDRAALPVGDEDGRGLP
ncbi:hypothetical protein ACLOJK_014624 [Asimina triloba]